MNKTVALLCVICACASLYGQRSYELGGWIGTSQYYGDLNNNFNLVTPRLAGGIIAKYNFNTRIATRLSLNAGRLSAADSTASNHFEKNRNLSFRSNFVDLNLGLEFNFFEYVRNVVGENYSPYLTIGASVIRHNPYTSIGDSIVYLRALGTEGQEENKEYSLITSALTVGLGFKWDVARDIGLVVEGSMRFTQSDYLDDVSSVYPDYDELESLRNKTAVDLSNRSINRIAGNTGNQRGNSSNNDRYMLLGISVLKYFGRLDCPRISNTRL